MHIKGVNLGNWLVLEKWMSPALFEGTGAQDEYYLPRWLSREVYEARIRIHRSEYITERDFAAIRAMGMEAVRIPVPYFIFGDREPFIGCVEELDRAFCWAERYGLKILIDLHTAPEGQNGFDNGGICGVCRWSKNPAEVEFVLGVLERLAKRYGEREGLWGIEVLNEPVTERMWKLMDVPGRYPPAEPSMAEGSGPVSMEFLRGFYLRAYDCLRRYMPEKKYVVIHDGFELKAWKDFMREDRYVNVVLDTHRLEEIPAGFDHIAIMGRKPIPAEDATEAGVDSMGNPGAGTIVYTGSLENGLTDERLSELFGMPIEVQHTHGRWAAYAV